MISAKIAFTLYGFIMIVAVLTLHGTALWLALVIVLGLSAKTLIDHLRKRQDH